MPQENLTFTPSSIASSLANIVYKDKRSVGYSHFTIADMLNPKSELVQVQILRSIAESVPPAPVKEAVIANILRDILPVATGYINQITTVNPTSLLSKLYNGYSAVTPQYAVFYTAFTAKILEAMHAIAVAKDGEATASVPSTILKHIAVRVFNDVVPRLFNSRGPSLYKIGLTYSVLKDILVQFDKTLIAIERTYSSSLTGKNYRCSFDAIVSEIQGFFLNVHGAISNTLNIITAEESAIQSVLAYKLTHISSFNPPNIRKINAFLQIANLYVSDFSTVIVQSNEPSEAELARLTAVADDLLPALKGLPLVEEVVTNSFFNNFDIDHIAKNDSIPGFSTNYARVAFAGYNNVSIRALDVAPVDAKFDYVSNLPNQTKDMDWIGGAVRATDRVIRDQWWPMIEPQGILHGARIVNDLRQSSPYSERLTSVIVTILAIANSKHVSFSIVPGEADLKVSYEVMKPTNHVTNTPGSIDVLSPFVTSDPFEALALILGSIRKVQVGETLLGHPMLADVVTKIGGSFAILTAVNDISKMADTPSYFIFGSRPTDAGDLGDDKFNADIPVDRKIVESRDIAIGELEISALQRNRFGRIIEKPVVFKMSELFPSLAGVQTSAILEVNRAAKGYNTMVATQLQSLIDAPLVTETNLIMRKIYLDFIKSLPATVYTAVKRRSDASVKFFIEPRNDKEAIALKACHYQNAALAACAVLQKLDLIELGSALQTIARTSFETNLNSVYDIIL